MDFHITSYPVLESTQDTACDLARSGAAEGVVIQAEEMTSGRGTHGRVWHAPTGNLYMSVILRPYIPARDIGQISFVAAVGIAKAIEAIIDDPARLALKWPNDILLEENKLCGILPESELDGDRVSYVILGVGINIHTVPPDEKATSLSAHILHPDIDISVFRDRVLAEIATAYMDWQEKRFELIREEWLKRAYRLGKDIKVSRPGGDKISGTFINLDEEGYLILSIDNELKRLSAGGIELE
jgi:BirA family transcriptional regulator, biotin operon repressor / biotin---[acetyl-CoA-carboxylase] ligase